MDKDFVFRLSEYDTDDLADEVAAALEKQVELNSRNRLPAMWGYIDRNNSRRASDKVIKRRKVYMKLYGALMLIMGIILLVPGLMDPKELTLLLVTGIFAVLVGVGCIWPWKKLSNRKFYKIAEKLLDGKRVLSENPENPILVHFTDEGMKFPDNSTIKYADFQTIIETENIYFLVWQGRVTILQKKDLESKGSESFLSFLEEMTKLQRITLVLE